jgi:hypothetical protein
MAIMQVFHVVSVDHGVMAAPLAMHVVVPVMGSVLRCRSGARCGH